MMEPFLKFVSEAISKSYFYLSQFWKNHSFSSKKKIKVVIYKGQNIKNNFLNKLKIMFNILNFDIV